MDYFIERLIKKRMDMPCIIKIAVCILLGVGLFFLSLLLWNFTQFFCFLIWAFIIWGVCAYIRNLFVEYEYIITNHEFDIDKIIAKSRRVRLANLDIRKIEKVARGTGQNETGIDKVCFYAPDKASQNLYYVIYVDDGARFMMIIDPNEAMLKVFKTYLSGKVFE